MSGEQEQGLVIKTKQDLVAKSHRKMAVFSNTTPDITVFHMPQYSNQPILPIVLKLGGMGVRVTSAYFSEPTWMSPRQSTAGK